MTKFMNMCELQCVTLILQKKNFEKMMDKYTFVLPFMSIFLLFMIAILISLIHKLQSNRTILKFYRIMTIHCMISYIFCCIADICHIALAKIQNQRLYEPHFHIVETVADIWFFTANISLYILIIGRLYFTFKLSAYKLSQWIVIGLLFLISLQITLTIIYCIGLFLDSKHNNYSFELGATISVEAVNDFIINTILLILFTTKLRKLIMTIKMPQSNVSSPIERKHSIYTAALIIGHQMDTDIVKRRQMLLKVIARYTIISCWIIICNQLWVTCNMIFYLFTSHDEITAVIMYLLRDFGATVIVLLLYLHFKFNWDTYFFLCRVCHNTCYQCCLQVMT
eukprot:356113_1